MILDIGADQDCPNGRSTSTPHQADAQSLGANVGGHKAQEGTTQQANCNAGKGEHEHQRKELHHGISDNDKQKAKCGGGHQGEDEHHLLVHAEERKPAQVVQSNINSSQYKGIIEALEGVVADLKNSRA